MKIVHTADIHLSSNYPERLEALKEILDKCHKEEAELLLITGDLFDKEVSVEELKPEIRPLFSDNSFKTLVIPGNHDQNAFREAEHFGNDIEILDNQPFDKVEFNDANIVGIPYTEKEFSELVEPLNQTLNDDKTNILMVHCTLKSTSGTYGEEKEYLPIEPEELVQTGFDYILAGHIHSSATKKSFGDTRFTYSGSPISISTKETGKREIWVIDLDEDKMETRELDTFHYLKKDIEVLPGDEEDSIKQLSSLQQKNVSKASIIVNVYGFTRKTTENLTSDIKKEISDLEPMDFKVNNTSLESISLIADSKIYKEFSEKMSDKNLEKPREVEKKFLRALSRYERKQH